MKKYYSIFIFLLTLSFSPAVFAQKRDSLRLICPLNDAVEAAPEKAGVNLGAPELKIVLSSPTDTLVKACTDVVISVVQRDEEGKMEIVFSHGNYWFWVSGLSKAIVRKDQKLKAGEGMGYVQPGQKIELLLYDFETPVDPKKYLTCGKQ
jgi:hypothetical protein